MAEQTELQAGLQNARDELSDREVAVATSKGEFNALQNSRQVLHQKIDTVVFEVCNLAEQEEGAKGRAQGLSARIREMEERARGVQEALGGHEQFVYEQREQRESAIEDLTEAKVALSKAEERKNSLLERETPMEQRLEEWES